MKHIKHYGMAYREDCQACIKKDKELELKMALLPRKLELLEDITKRASEYRSNYMKALKEIWQEPIDRQRDLAILEKYGLVSDWKYNRTGYQWNYDLVQLDKEYKQALKI